MSVADAARVRPATGADAEAVAAIYGPVVRDTTASFEVVAPTVAEMRVRIEQTVQRLPWLVSTGPSGSVDGYAYAARHRLRAAYDWSVDVSVYVDADRRGTGVGSRLYARLLDDLVGRGYVSAFAAIAVPNPASVALHESFGFAPVGVFHSVGFKLGAWRDVGWWQRPLRTADVPPPLLSH